MLHGSYILLCVYQVDHFTPEMVWNDAYAKRKPAWFSGVPSAGSDVSVPKHG